MGLKNKTNILCFNIILLLAFNVSDLRTHLQEHK